MSEIRIKDNESLDSALKGSVLNQAYFRKFVKESTMRSQA